MNKAQNREGEAHTLRKEVVRQKKRGKVYLEWLRRDRRERGLLVDYLLGELCGLRACFILPKSPPFFFLSGVDGTELASDALFEEVA